MRGRGYGKLAGAFLDASFFPVAIVTNSKRMECLHVEPQT